MDLEFIKIVASLGVGALFGIIVFLFYRADKKETESQLTELVRKTQNDFTELHKDTLNVLRDNTKTIGELLILLSRIDGRLDK